MPFDPAITGAVAALEDNPFYRSISTSFGRDIAQRRAALAQYFAYSIREGQQVGRCVRLADQTRGVAVWLLPQQPDIQAQLARQKREFLETCLGQAGRSAYDRILRFMNAKGEAIVDKHAWYLSIVAVDPAVQGKGFGRELLAPTLDEADEIRAVCYLETFNPRTIPFYERVGFVNAERFHEPTTGAEYTIMVRQPKPLSQPSHIELSLDGSAAPSHVPSKANRY